MSLLKAKPYSGESAINLYVSGDATSEIIGSVPTGSVLRASGESAKFYTVDYAANTIDEAQGGVGNNGTVLAYPNTGLYNNINYSKEIGILNNGTPIEILDDSNSKIFKVKGMTNNGLLEGYLRTRFITRNISDDTSESEPSPAMMKSRSTPMSSTRSGNTKGTVTSSSGVSTYQTYLDIEFNSFVAGTLHNGATVNIHETKNGFMNVSLTSGSSEGLTYNVWVGATYIKVDGTETQANVSKNDVVPIGPAIYSGQALATFDGIVNIEDSEVPTSNLNVMYSGANALANDEYYALLADKYMNVLGEPYRYKKSTDPRYYDTTASGYYSAGYGRAIASTVMNNPAILSIMPGKAVMFPEIVEQLSGDEGGFLSELLSVANGELSNLITQDNENAFTGRLYTFKADTASYAREVNAILRTTAVMMGIGDNLVPGTQTKYSTFDYTYWTIRKRYDSAKASNVALKDTGFKEFWEGLVSDAENLLTAAVTDTNYINFFITEGRVSETMSNDTTSSPLDSLLNAGADISATLNYFIGSGFDISSTDAMAALESMAGDGITGGVLNIGENLVKGGRMAVPKMLSGASYGRTYTATQKLYSAYGDKESLFLRCMIPIGHWIPLAVPRQLSSNMYTFPYVIRCGQLGRFNSDLAVVSSLSITPSGDETAYTLDGIPTEWDISIDITPLIDNLMISSTSHPFLLAENDSMLDYLATFSGFDLLSYNPQVKLDLLESLFVGGTIDIPRSLEHKVSDFMYQNLNSIFRL